MNSNNQQPVKSSVLTTLRITALLTAIATVAQFLIGGYQFTAHNESLLSAHNIIGLMSIGTALAATIAAAVHARAGGNRGLMFHVIGTAVLILVQYGLGEMISSQALVIVHMVLGVAIMLSAIAMTTIAFRKPFARA